MFGLAKVDRLSKRFHKASEGHGDVEVMKKIIEEGLDPNKPCSELGWFPIHATAFKGQLEIVKILVEKGVDVDQRNGQHETALMLAVMYNRTETVKYLLEKGANPRAADWTGRTVLDAANGSFIPNGEAKLLLEEALGKAPTKSDTEKKKRTKVTPCRVCAAASTQRCGQCKSVSYCSRECQRKYFRPGSYEAGLLCN